MMATRIIYAYEIWIMEDIHEKKDGRLKCEYFIVSIRSKHIFHEKCAFFSKSRHSFLTQNLRFEVINLVWNINARKLITFTMNIFTSSEKREREKEYIESQRHESRQSNEKLKLHFNLKFQRICNKFSFSVTNLQKNIQKFVRLHKICEIDKNFV